MATTTVSFFIPAIADDVRTEQDFITRFRAIDASVRDGVTIPDSVALYIAADFAQWSGEPVVTFPLGAIVDRESVDALAVFAACGRLLAKTGLAGARDAVRALETWAVRRAVQD